MDSPTQAWATRLRNVKDKNLETRVLDLAVNLWIIWLELNKLCKVLAETMLEKAYLLATRWCHRPRILCLIHKLWVEDPLVLQVTIRTAIWPSLTTRWWIVEVKVKTEWIWNAALIQKVLKAESMLVVFRSAQLMQQLKLTLQLPYINIKTYSLKLNSSSTELGLLKSHTSSRTILRVPLEVVAWLRISLNNSKLKTCSQAQTCNSNLKILHNKLE